MGNPFAHIRDYFRQLPDKKQYIEVITATLSIPVLLSVIFMNYINIQEKRNPQTADNDQVTEETNNTKPTVITIIQDNPDDDTPTPTPDSDSTPTISPEECIKEIGPIDINTPAENSTISGNPLEVDVEYEQGDYCSVVWSYRINEGSWSDYTDDDIVIYNMGSGKKTLELRVRSLVSTENKTLRRIFTYTNTDEAPTPTYTPTPTAGL